jgi:4-hydroxybenzoate polyprenyltransferase
MRHYLRLVRIPTVFSSFSNAFAGYWIGGGVAGWHSLALGLIAAGLFVMAGMALNDIADLEDDRTERPDRPLPSGAISMPTAWLLVAGMFTLALILQWLASPVSALVGLLLIGAIFLYNFVLKGTVLGPVSMGLCRLLNLAAGMALNFASFGAFRSQPAATYGALLSLGLYVALVTYLARDEVQGNSIRRVRYFLIGMAAWFAAWSAWSVTHFSWRSLLAFAVLIFHAWLLRDVVGGLRRSPTSPAATGKTVGALLRTLPVTDTLGMLAAGVVFWPFGLDAAGVRFGVPWALLGLAWMLPGRFLARRFYST